jgi:N utilization substance protein B
MEEKKNNTGTIVPKSRRDMRALAFHFLYAIDRLDYAVSLDEVVECFRVGFNVIVDNDSLAVKMARGTLEVREELDEQIKPLLRNWRLERLGCCTRIILQLALWELRQDEAIPSIVINEAIELAKAFAEKDAYKFVNGILDEAYKKSIAHLTKEKHESNGNPVKPDKDQK